MRLIDLQSGQPINIHDKVVTFKGDIGYLRQVMPPLHEGDAGRVFVQPLAASYAHEWFPNVIGAKFEDEEEQT